MEPPLDKLLNYIDSKEQEMLQLWRELVLTESPSYHKAGVDAVGAILARYCREELGYHIRFQDDPVYGNCLAVCSCPF